MESKQSRREALTLAQLTAAHESLQQQFSGLQQQLATALSCQEQSSILVRSLASQNLSLRGQLADLNKESADKAGRDKQDVVVARGGGGAAGTNSPRIGAPGPASPRASPRGGALPPGINKFSFLPFQKEERTQELKPSKRSW